MVTTTTFQDAFDDDDTLTYNPMYTGAIIISEWQHTSVQQPDASAS